MWLKFCPWCYFRFDRERFIILTGTAWRWEQKGTCGVVDPCSSDMLIAQNIWWWLRKVCFVVYLTPSNFFKCLVNILPCKALSQSLDLSSRLVYNIIALKSQYTHRQQFACKRFLSCLKTERKVGLIVVNIWLTVSSFKQSCENYERYCKQYCMV